MVAQPNRAIVLLPPNPQVPFLPDDCGQPAEKQVHSRAGKVLHCPRLFMQVTFSASLLQQWRRLLSPGTVGLAPLASHVWTDDCAHFPHPEPSPLFWAAGHSFAILTRQLRSCGLAAAPAARARPTGWVSACCFLPRLLPTFVCYGARGLRTPFPFPSAVDVRSHGVGSACVAEKKAEWPAITMSYSSPISPFVCVSTCRVRASGLLHCFWRFANSLSHPTSLILRATLGDR